MTCADFLAIHALIAFPLTDVLSLARLTRSSWPLLSRPPRLECRRPSPVADADAAARRRTTTNGDAKYPLLPMHDAADQATCLPGGHVEEKRNDEGFAGWFLRFTIKFLASADRSRRSYLFVSK
jgi:hypothetical protein